MDAYAVLGVPPTASAAEIKRAYRQLAKRCHPDAHPDDPSAAARFYQINAAYAQLQYRLREPQPAGSEGDEVGDEKQGVPRESLRRREDDPSEDGASTAASPRSGSAAHKVEPEGTLSNVRERIRGFFPGGPGALIRNWLRGVDFHLTLSLSLEDACAGRAQRLSLPGGRRLQIKLPRGVEDGQLIRLKGQGRSGYLPGFAGDAFVTVHIEPHALFRREGADIYLDAPITLHEAISGAQVKVPTLRGSVAVQVPPHSNSGTLLRLKGQGAPGQRSASQGDQYVRLVVMLPPDAPAALEGFVSAWPGARDYEVREKFKST